MDARRWRDRKKARQTAAKRKEGTIDVESGAAGMGMGRRNDSGAGTGLGSLSSNPVLVADEDDSPMPGRSEWWPSEEDLACAASGGQAPDADAPVLGDVALSVELDLAQLNLSPTIIVSSGVGEEGELGGKAGGGDTSRASDGASAVARRAASAAGDESATAMSEEARDAADDDELSVRYFMRVTVYTSFNAGARVWDALEIFFYRSGFYGQFIAKQKKPHLTSLPPMSLSSPVSIPSGGGGHCETSPGSSVVVLDVGTTPPISPLLSAFPSVSSGAHSSVTATGRGDFFAAKG